MTNLHTALYGNFRNRKFTDVWNNASSFVAEYQSNGIGTTISENSARTLFYLLYAHYGNSTIASSDESRFKYQLFSIVFAYGPTWEKRLEVQNALRELDLDALIQGTTQINNQALNPGSAPSTQATQELEAINAQYVTKYRKDPATAYATLLDLLETDVTMEFINRFKRLFLRIVQPELPLWYSTTINTEDNI